MDATSSKKWTVGQQAIIKLNKLQRKQATTNATTQELLESKDEARKLTANYSGHKTTNISDQNRYKNNSDSGYSNQQITEQIPDWKSNNSGGQPISTNETSENRSKKTPRRTQNPSRPSDKKTGMMNDCCLYCTHPSQQFTSSTNTQHTTRPEYETAKWSSKRRAENDKKDNITALATRSIPRQHTQAIENQKSCFQHNEHLSGSKRQITKQQQKRRNFTNSTHNTRGLQYKHIFRVELLERLWKESAGPSGCSCSNQQIAEQAKIINVRDSRTMAWKWRTIRLQLHESTIYGTTTRTQINGCCDGEWRLIMRHSSQTRNYARKKQRTNFVSRFETTKAKNQQLVTTTTFHPSGKAKKINMWSTKEHQNQQITVQTNNAHRKQRKTYHAAPVGQAKHDNSVPTEAR